MLNYYLSTMETLPPAPKRSTQLLGIGILLATLFAFTLFGGSALLFLFQAESINANVLAASRILFWASLLIIFLYARKIEDQKLLLWEERKFVFWEYLVSVMAIFFALFVGLSIIALIVTLLNLHEESTKMQKLMAIFREHQFLIFLTAITAGVVEELTFRGYIQPRLTRIFKSPALGIIISSVFFGLLHFGYGTVIQLVGPFFIGFIFALYYYKFRNIKVLIFCHIAWDIMAIYAQMLLKKP